MATENLVVAHKLHRTFYDKTIKTTTTALQELSLTIPQGRMTAIIGPDGAGKTTLMRLICGLLAPHSGDLEVLGMDVRTHAAEIQARISYMPQKFGLYEDLTVEENMNLYADLHGIPQETREQRFARLLEMTGMAAFTKRLAGKLSGGMKQKLGLACTLVRSPELLLLDEPTVGVDPLSRRELWQIIKELVRTEHLTVLVSTAYMEEAELCDDVYVLHKGKLLFSGTPCNLRSLAQGLCYSLTPPDSTPNRIVQSALLDDPSVMDAVPEGGSVRFMLREQNTLEQLNVYTYFGQLPTHQVPPRLEDGFMLLLHQNSSEQSAVTNTQDFVLDYNKDFTLSDKIDITVKDLVRTFGDFIAVNHTTFNVRRGEVFGLLGPNGAGKTTIFRMLCGLLPASGGELAVAGVNLRYARTQARANIGYVAQKFSLYGTLTVDENLRFYAGVYGLSDDMITKRMQEVKVQFELTDVAHTPAEQLPGGYKQRLSMAAALMHKPRILFLDEPTSGIDPLARRIFWRQITALAAQGTTIIITTHFMEEAEYCDRIMIQDQGKMLALGTPEAIRQEGHGDNMNAAFIGIVEAARAAEGMSAS